MSRGLAFVAGATGYTGREVVAAAVAAGLRTVAHVRPDSPRRAEWTQVFGTAGAEVDDTPWEAAALAERLRELEPTVVFALLGTTRARGRAATPGREESYETVDVGLTIALLDAAKRAPSRPRFCYLSAAGAGPRSRSAYYAARHRTEQRIRESGLAWTIARPAIITGPDRDEARPAERIAATVSDAGLALLGALGAGRLRERWRSTTNVALARALVRVALDPTGENRVVEADELRG